MDPNSSPKKLKWFGNARFPILQIVLNKLQQHTWVQVQHLNWIVSVSSCIYYFHSFCLYGTEGTEISRKLLKGWHEAQHPYVTTLLIKLTVKIRPMKLQLRCLN
jgi:hypothetical protein